MIWFLYALTALCTCHNTLPWLVCPPVQETAQAQKWNTYASNRCSHNRDNWLALSAKELRGMATHAFHTLAIQPRQMLLDWGCGCGTKARYLESKYNATVVGLDLSSVAVKYAAAHTNQSRFCVSSGVSLGWLPSNFFDTVYGICSYSYLSPTGLCAALKESLRVVKPGGTVAALYNYRVKWSNRSTSFVAAANTCHAAGLNATAEIAVQPPQFRLPKWIGVKYSKFSDLQTVLWKKHASPKL
eukprot:NODE_4190_length_828_cov_57.238231_g4032_i0.p1 GENE.NODE_4190_length_828_cov_57.238231_g4032_i0~~NODE_4190_length_828_cov_57.238231_g4032_i0.p1  ORF type:complete len:243 (-),score=42.23 NODE_4190_length_828_cov_57.238231_g4032_i0:18-746(-)